MPALPIDRFHRHTGRLILAGIGKLDVNRAGMPLSGSERSTRKNGHRVQFDSIASLLFCPIEGPDPKFLVRRLQLRLR